MHKEVIMCHLDHLHVLSLSRSSKEQSFITVAKICYYVCSLWNCTVFKLLSKLIN